MAAEINVHVITPLISKGFRDDARLADAFKGMCRITASCLDKGPASVESAVDEVLAAPGVVDVAIRAERAGADVVVIDCMLDPGLEASREAVSIPVIGAGEAGLSAAAERGRFSVVTVLDRQAPMFRDLARRHGLSDQLVSVRGIGVPVLALEQDRTAAIARTTPACAAAMAEDRAEAIVFGCTGMLGFAEPVAEAMGLPDGIVIDPLPNAVYAALAAVRAGVPARPTPERKAIAGFEAWTCLSDLMGPEADA